MKGIVFTLDAIFALIIAMASISILLYFHYFSQTPYLVNYQKAQEIAQMLAGTEVANIQNSSQIAASIARQSQGYNYTWPQFMNNAYAEAQNPYGPFEPFVSYIFTAPNPITTGIVAGYGNIYFASGTTSSATLFAVNASTNATRWTKATSEIVSTPVLYNNMLIYINQTNMTAVSPLNGSTIWTTNTIVSGTLFSSTRVTTPLIAYDSKVFFGTSSDNVYAMYLNNKTLAWSVSTGAGEQPQFIAIAQGNLVVKTTSGELMLIAMQGSSAGIAWSKPSLGVTSPVASQQQVIYFGNGDYVNATYTNGTAVSGFPGGTSQVVYDGVPQIGTVYYQLASGLMAVSKTGSQLWSITVPSYFGTAVSSSSSLIASNGYLYALWTNGLSITNTTSRSTVFTQIPRAYGTIENMSLAYGRLYVAVGNRVIAYGSCPVNANLSVLSASAILYANRYGSCADSLLNTVQTTQNYGVFINSSFGPSTSVAKFNGNSYAQAQNQQWLNNSLVMASFWINISSTPSAPVNIVSYGNNATNVGWLFYLNKSDVVRFDIMNGTGQAIVSTQPLSLNKWYNIIGAYNGSYLAIYVNGVMVPQYINGVEKPNKKISTSIIAPPRSINLTIGGSGFNGEIANLQIYSMPLRINKIADIASEGIGGAPIQNSSVGWWPLQGDVNDYSRYSDAGYPVGLGYTSAGYVPSSYASAYDVNKAYTLLPILNYTTGNTITENVGVYTWH